MKAIFNIIAKLIPKGIRKKVQTTLMTYGIPEQRTNTVIGTILFASILIGVTASIPLDYFLNVPLWATIPVTILAINVIAYIFVHIIIERKNAVIEEALPDALLLIASNLRAGMTPDKALLLSAKPEFGPLKDEIYLVGKKITMGKNISRALIEMSERTHSRRLLLAVEMINSGLNSGGSLANLLEATADRLKEQILIDKKIKASITMYVIFIFAATAIITPVLLGLSSVLQEIIKSTISQISLPPGSLSIVPIQTTNEGVSSKFLTMFIIIFLSVNSLMASLLLGLIAKGKRIVGLNYFLPMITIAVPLFLLISYIAKKSLQNLFSF
jgi:archaeal flagellar protein FlaJ